MLFRSEERPEKTDFDPCRWHVPEGGPEVRWPSGFARGVASCQETNREEERPEKTDFEKVSHKLCYFLRWERKSLKKDDDGYADLDELMRFLPRRYTKEFVFEVAENSGLNDHRGRKRFQVIEGIQGKYRVRALKLFLCGGFAAKNMAGR